MKLLTEFYGHIESLTENTSSGKHMYLEGIFAQANIRNNNGRNYPKPILESAVEVYKNGPIASNKSYGEINHPSYPLPDISKAAIRITELHWEGNNVIGKAKILENNHGLQLKSLIEDGFPLGVSTRGLGVVKDSVVNKFLLNAIDAVNDPSGPNCYPHAVNESTQDWVEENGIWVLKESDKELDEAAFFNALDKSLEILKKRFK
jgi:hypothetical protein